MYLVENVTVGGALTRTYCAYSKRGKVWNGINSRLGLWCFL